MKEEFHVHIHFRKRTILGLLAALLLCIGAYQALSDTLTFTTYYPSPFGVYGRLISTKQTILARDSGGVVIGTGTLTTEKLLVAGHIRLGDDTTNYRILNVADPIAATDVATKAYVDAAGGGGCYTDWANDCAAGFTSLKTWSWGACINSFIPRSEFFVPTTVTCPGGMGPGPFNSLGTAALCCM